MAQYDSILTIYGLYCRQFNYIYILLYLLIALNFRVEFARQKLVVLVTFVSSEMLLCNSLMPITALLFTCCILPGTVMSGDLISALAANAAH